MDPTSNLAYRFVDKKKIYDNKVRKPIPSRLIVRNIQSTWLYTYLKEQYSISTKNYLRNIVDTVTLITAFGTTLVENRVVVEEVIKMQTNQKLLYHST